MFKFFSEAMQELEHVVWPTRNETHKYMLYTVGVIVSMSLLLAILGFGIRGGLSFIRDQFPHTTQDTNTVSGESLNLDDIVTTPENAVSGEASGKLTLPVNNQ